MKNRIIMHLLFGIVIIACRKKADQPEPITSTKTEFIETAINSDTGRYNSYYAEKMDAYFYLDRYIEAIYTDSTTNFESRDRAYCFSYSDTSRKESVNNFNITFGITNVYYDSFFKRCDINFLGLDYPFVRKIFSFPAFWQADSIGVLPSYKHEIKNLPDSCNFASLQRDTLQVGKSFDIKLNKPTSGTDSVLVQVVSRSTGRSISKVFKSGYSTYPITGQETSIFNKTGGELIIIEILQWKRDRVYLRDKKYVFETGRVFQKMVFFK